MTCRKCHRSKPKRDFPKRRATCRKCIGAKIRAFRATREGRARRKGEHQRRLARNRAVYRAIKRAMRCFFCPESEPCCIDFHHIRRSEKGRRAIPDSLINSIANLIAEISKCVAICANCHRKIHYGKLRLPRNVKPISAKLLWRLVQ